MSRHENKDFSSLPSEDDAAPPYTGPAHTQSPPPPLPQMGVYGYDQPREGQFLSQSQQVVVSQGQQQMGIAVESPPFDWTIPAILSCIFCFWPTGIFAIIFANKANITYGMHDYAGSRSSAKAAQVLTLTTIAIGIAFTVATIVAVVVLTSNSTDNTAGNFGDNHADKIGNDLGNLGNDLNGALNDLVATTRKSPFPFK